MNSMATTLRGTDLRCTHTRIGPHHRRNGQRATCRASSTRRGILGSVVLAAASKGNSSASEDIPLPALRLEPLSLQPASQASVVRAGVAKADILKDLGNELDPFYKLNDKLQPKVLELVLENPSSRPGPETFLLGQGEWQVFHAPHLVRLSSSVGATVNPIRYRLEGQKLYSNVKYYHPLIGTGWLSASGSLKIKDTSTVTVHFDKFWIDGTELREQLPEDEGSMGPWKMLTGGQLGNKDSWLGLLGRAAFFEGLADFPVLYLDQDMAVFRFPPLQSSIAVRKLPVLSQ